jgi:hypothetical protein
MAGTAPPAVERSWKGLLAGEKVVDAVDAHL